MQFTFQACADLNEIWESMAMPSDPWGSGDAEHLAAARSFAEKLEQLCQLLVLHPEMGSVRDELKPGIRSVLLNRYVIFYRVRGNGVEVMRVLRASRELDAIA
ncbi:MAG: type II toxin-antitoxin system RelE/ParE family toxin [Proteobacteria bacterium]|jgi:toxin ParE1/3/4|nr:type II toxin-antitoxin system RelE/ParE family toxin [Pseudomonadota bacterium]